MVAIHPQIRGDDVNDVCRQVMDVVDAADGYASSADSMNSGQEIREVFNLGFQLMNPRRRIFRSELPIFNPGQAAFRFIFLLSGSNLIEQVAHYTGRFASRFTDDGETMPSAYGERIFSGDANRPSQFNQAARVILDKPNTKRAQITMYDWEDLGRARFSNDLPCVSSITFMPRGAVLNMTVSMRANDAAKLLVYNIFEFTLLQECMACLLDMTLGSYWHSAVSMHIRGDLNNQTPKIIGEQFVSPEMQPMGEFTGEIHLKVLNGEEEIRKAGRFSKAQLNCFLTGFKGNYPAFWAEMLSTVACEAYLVQSGKTPSSMRDVIEAIASIAEDRDVLLKAHQEYLLAQLALRGPS